MLSACERDDANTKRHPLYIRGDREKYRTVPGVESVPGTWYIYMPVPYMYMLSTYIRCRRAGIISCVFFVRPVVGVAKPCWGDGDAWISNAAVNMAAMTTTAAAVMRSMEVNANNAVICVGSTRS